MKANIVKHVEHTELYFNFSDTFKVADTPDNIFINLLDNIENRL